MAASRYPKLEMPANVERRAVRIWSGGIPLDGDVYRPKGLGAADKCPAVVLTHGWGGNKLTGERYAAKFAASQMITVCFTHSGWGDSGGPLWIAGKRPEFDSAKEAVVKVREARDFVDPIDWIRNFRAAVNFVAGEANVDSSKIGAWGTSYGGGIATYCAATDSRMKALVSQVGLVFDVFTEHEALRTAAKARAITMARGESEPFPEVGDTFATVGGKMPGMAHFPRMLEYDIDDKVKQLSIPTLIVDAAKEEHFQLAHSGYAAYEAVKSKGNIPTQYELIPGIGHFGIYFEGYERSSQLAHDWFVKFLKES